MPTQQKCSVYSSIFGRSRPASTVCAARSAGLAHLARVEFTEPAGPTRGTGAEDVSLWEPALSLEELAAELSVTCQTLYDLRSQGRGPRGFRVGRRLRFRRSEILAWLERMEAEDDQRRHGGGR
jgi:excisionase family DNA binding protein